MRRRDFTGEGYTGTVKLARLTRRGSDGWMTFYRGRLTGYLAPT